MIERPKWHEGAIEASKNFEQAWKIFAHPGGHTAAEVIWASEFLMSQMGNYKIVMALGGLDDLSTETLDQVFMGIYHKRGKLSLGTKLHPNSN